MSKSQDTWWNIYKPILGHVKLLLHGMSSDVSIHTYVHTQTRTHMVGDRERDQIERTLTHTFKEVSCVKQSCRFRTAFSRKRKDNSTYSRTYECQMLSGKHAYILHNLPVIQRWPQAEFSVRSCLDAAIITGEEGSGENDQDQFSGTTTTGMGSKKSPGSKKSCL